jgi:hypothetical protein
VKLSKRILREVFRGIARIYFREIEVAGDVPQATTGARLFAANHVNALVDPILVLTHAPCLISPIAKSTLWLIPGLRLLLDAADAVPIVRRRDDPNKSATDNDAIFARIAAHLGSGGNILIFPEGTSHNEPHLLPLRSGAGRMLGRASEEAEDLTFQAVALEFDARDLFRSRALVLFGPVRRVADVQGDLSVEITEILRDDLSELLVEGATWDERILVVRVAEMFANDGNDVSLESMNRIGRRIEAARRILADNDVHAMEGRLRGYFERLAAEETSDAIVANVAQGKPPAPAPERAAMIAMLPLALIAVPLYWLPYQLPRWVTQRMKADPDVASTYKLGVGLLVYPLWALAAIVLAFRFLTIELALVAAVVIVVSPFAALGWLDRWDRIADRMRQLAPSEQRRERLQDLAAERTSLMRDLEAVRARVE